MPMPLGRVHGRGGRLSAPVIPRYVTRATRTSSALPTSSHVHSVSSAPVWAREPVLLALPSGAQPVGEDGEGGHHRVDEGAAACRAASRKVGQHGLHLVALAPEGEASRRSLPMSVAHSGPAGLSASWFSCCGARFEKRTRQFSDEGKRSSRAAEQACRMRAFD